MVFIMHSFFHVSVLVLPDIHSKVCVGTLARVFAFPPLQVYNIHGWWVGELKGAVGIVPKDFLDQAYIL